MKRNLVCIGCVVFGLVGFSMPLIAQDKAGGQDPASDPQMEEMMKKWVEIATPGEKHKNLDAYAGAWDIAGKLKFAEEAPWIESKSEAKSEWMMGGRFLVQHVKGEPIPGMPLTHPFEGIAVLGYDNSAKKYNAIWFDNYGTMMMIANGDADASGKVITLRGSCEDPMTGQPAAFRWVYRSEGKDAFVMEMYGPGPDGKEFMNGELKYSRKSN